MNPTQLHSESVNELSFQPLVHEFERVPDKLEAFRRFSQLDKCLFLESSKSVSAFDGKPLGRYSFLMAAPFHWLEIASDVPNGLEQIRESFKGLSTTRLPNLPPFQGGMAGLLSYDLNRSLEDLAAPKYKDFDIPAIAMGGYDVVLTWDHTTDRAYLISQGLPETDIDARQERARSRLEQFLRILTSPCDTNDSVNPITAQDYDTPSFEVPGPEGLLSNFSRSNYIQAVQRAIEYIRAGDVFQINFAQRLLYPANCHSSQLYQRLRRCNPAPFSGYFDLGPTQVVSASPERLIGMQNGMVESRPIKGTRKRTRYPEVDLISQRELKHSEKDRAENTMIVDLMRNDLSRVCTDNSVEVTQLCELEEYESVLHLVSAVQGRLRAGLDAIDLVQAVFPGGSITGAPKIRAMQIIAELEQTARGAYCGSLGYIGFDGSLDFNILIRTITASNGWWQIPVGGGIVSQSDPEQEYEETWTKAAGMLRAVRP